MPKPVILPSTPPRKPRPRTKPVDASPHTWWATDREYAQVQDDAKEAGVSVQEYVRRMLIRDRDPAV